MVFGHPRPKWDERGAGAYEDYWNKIMNIPNEPLYYEGIDGMIGYPAEEFQMMLPEEAPMDPEDEVLIADSTNGYRFPKKSLRGRRFLLFPAAGAGAAAAGAAAATAAAATAAAAIAATGGAGVLGLGGLLGLPLLLG